MLSAVEIVELEKKVFKYRLKQRIHYFILTFLFVTLLVSGFIFYPSFNRVTEEVQKQPDLITQNKIEPIVENNTTIITPLETHNSVKYSPDSIIEQKTDETLLLQLPIISNKNNSDKKISYVPEPLEKKSSFDIQEEELENKILARKTQKY